MHIQSRALDFKSLTAIPHDETRDFLPIPGFVQTSRYAPCGHACGPQRDDDRLACVDRSGQSPIFATLRTSCAHSCCCSRTGRWVCRKRWCRDLLSFFPNDRLNVTRACAYVPLQVLGVTSAKGLNAKMSQKSTVNASFALFGLVYKVALWLCNLNAFLHSSSYSATTGTGWARLNVKAKILSRQVWTRNYL